MSSMTVPVPMRSGVHARPGLGRLVAVELRNLVNTRAGLWLQVATVAITLVAVVVRLVLGEAADHTFAAVLQVGVFPAAVSLPVVGIWLVTSEWSQRTGMITFALVPQRSRVLGAKLIASMILSVALLSVSVSIVTTGALVASPSVDGAWADAAPLIAQSGVYPTAGMITGVAFGLVVLASTPAIVALFALPIAWTAVGSLSVFADAASWSDTRLALGPLPQELLSATQWAHAGTALALWMLLPLVAGSWRFTRTEVAS
jgi:ABC-2 type transport system permease protein